MAPMVTVPVVTVPVTPSPIIQKYAKRVQSISVKKLGLYSTEPIRLTKRDTKQSTLLDKSTLLDVEQIDTTVFQVDVVDDDGRTNTFTLVVPDPEEDDE